MAVYKEEKTGTWRVIYRYTDWTGEKKQTQKRGFQTKREAQAWEREQLNKARADLDMTFKSFVEQYTADMQTRIKENTWATKEHIIRSKLLPYFGKLKMSNITAQQIITWQNELMNYKDENGKALSPVYLKTINNQLSAIFNHAVKFYNLKENPCRKAGSMGKKKNREMLFWTKEEYLKFAEVMMDKPQFYYAFEMLYWCGIREGELLALTPADFDFKKGTVSINKSYQRLNGRDVNGEYNAVVFNNYVLPDTESISLEMLYSIYAVKNAENISSISVVNDWFEKKVVGPKITDKEMLAEFYSYSIALKDYSNDDYHEMNYGHIATEEELLQAYDQTNENKMTIMLETADGLRFCLEYDAEGGWIYSKDTLRYYRVTEEMEGWFSVLSKD